MYFPKPKIKLAQINLRLSLSPERAVLSVVVVQDIQYFHNLKKVRSGQGVWSGGAQAVRALSLALLPFIYYT